MPNIVWDEITYSFLNFNGAKKSIDIVTDVMELSRQPVNLW